MPAGCRWVVDRRSGQVEIVSLGRMQAGHGPVVDWMQPGRSPDAVGIQAGPGPPLRLFAAFPEPGRRHCGGSSSVRRGGYGRKGVSAG
jgi:hypothetical protein